MLSLPVQSLTPWIKACVLHTIGVLGLTSPTIVERVETHRHAAESNDLMRETAAWTLARLERSGSGREVA